MIARALAVLWPPARRQRRQEALRRIERAQVAQERAEHLTAQQRLLRTSGEGPAWNAPTAAHRTITRGQAALYQVDPDPGENRH